MKFRASVVILARVSLLLAILLLTISGAQAQPPPAYLLLSGTFSPDGRYAMGWGLPAHPDLWKRVVQGDSVFDAVYNAKDEVENYVIDLQKNQIAGPIPTQYWQLKDGHPNHYHLIADWSTTGDILLALFFGGYRWDPGSLEACLMKDGKVQARLDVHGELETVYRRHLAEANRRGYKKDRKKLDFSFTDIVAREGEAFSTSANVYVEGADTYEHFSASAALLFTINRTDKGKLALKVQKVDEHQASSDDDSVKETVRDDRALNAVYAALRLQLDSADKDALKLEQREWLASRDKVTDRDERAGFISARIGELEDRVRKLIHQPTTADN